MNTARTILVTGASGFIGGRIVEILHTSGSATVRAGIRRWSAAARVGRLPVDLVRCDITSPVEVAGALDGVTHLIHCAVGDRTVTVDGTTVLDGRGSSDTTRLTAKAPFQRDPVARHLPEQLRVIQDDVAPEHHDPLMVLKAVVDLVEDVSDGPPKPVEGIYDEHVTLP